jgi:hypothetical protein
MLYKELAEECGKPIEVSDNGRYLIFKKSELSTEISLVEITLNGLHLLKKIDFKKEVLNKIKEKETQDMQNYTVMMKYWLSCLLELKNMALIRFQFCINDSADVTVRIRPKADSYRQIIEHIDILSLENNELTMDEEDIKRAFKEQLSFFYYQ